MKSKTKLLGIEPVLPSSNIERDLAWYNEKIGFNTLFANEMYAVIYRGEIFIHLQWHADTVDDPLLGGSVARIKVDNIKPIFEEFVKTGCVLRNDLKLNTNWRTNEFGFYDLNNNAIFFMEDI